MLRGLVPRCPLTRCSLVILLLSRFRLWRGGDDAAVSGTAMLSHSLFSLDI